MMKLTAILTVLLLAPHAVARKPEPLPDFTLTAMDGKTVPSSQLHLPNRWLLFYVYANSRHNGPVLNILKDEKPNLLGAKMIVIVGGAGAQEAQAIAKEYPHLNQVTWYADPKRDAFRAMKLQAAPVVLGLRESTVQWTLVGSLPKPENMKSILKTWKDKDK